MKPEQNAHDLWTAIKDHFLDNKEQRAIFLSNQLYSFVQGDLSVSEYCTRMKTTADALRDVGHSISEPQLVRNLLRGLNARFSNTADDIANTVPFPSFTKARSMLSLKESRLANEIKVATETAMVASSGPAATCSPGRAHGLPCNGAPQWRLPAPSVLGPPPQARTVFTPSQPSQPATPSWDQSGLVAAMNQMALQNSNNWVMDSGASSHMASRDGPADPSRDHALQ